MRTKTGILWTILVIACLLVLESDSMDPVNITVATTAQTSNSSPPAATMPSPGASTTAKSFSVEATTANSTSTEPPPAKTVPAEPPTTTTVPADPPITNHNATESPTTKHSTTEPPAIATNLTTVKFTSTEAPPAKSTAKDSTTTEPTTAMPIAAEPTTARPTTTEPTTAKPAHAGPIPAKSTSATSANPPPATQGPSSVVPTHRPDQTTTSETPALTTITAKPPASTQPGPDQTSQGTFISSQQPSLAVFQTSKPSVREPFNETITQEFMQEARNKENSSVQSCLMLLEKLGVKGNCILTGEKVDGRYTFTSASVAVGPSVIQDIYDSISTTPPDSTPVPHTLIAILSSCGALVLILVIFALYCTYHHRSYRKNQQHLTEELQTVENGYHDNPTLEVMEVQPEMQEKKVALNGEFNDSWIVPFDNLAKEEIPDEEDTHL